MGEIGVFGAQRDVCACMPLRDIKVSMCGLWVEERTDWDDSDWVRVWMIFTS